MSARSDGGRRPLSAFFVIFFVTPLTVYLGAPLIMNSAVAQQECEQIAMNRLGISASLAKAEWVLLPPARWECVVEGGVVARMGWMATEGSDASVELLPE